MAIYAGSTLKVPQRLELGRGLEVHTMVEFFAPELMNAIPYPL
jgi:hypothetical protein